MAEIFIENPDYENGRMSFFGFDEAEKVLPCAAEVVSELLNKWNTNVVFISLTSRSEALKALVKNESKVARLYTIDQKNPDPDVILRKARGMVNRRFVRAIVLEGITINPQQIEEWQEHFKHWSCTHEIILGVCESDE
jgi:hypothetical protein